MPRAITCFTQKCAKDREYQSRRAHRVYKAEHHLLKKYGISSIEYDNRVQRQKGKCLICGKSPKRLHVDHDHETNKNRDLLCSQCNMALGLFHDDVDVLRKAALYVERHRST